MAQLHININSSIKYQAQQEVKKHGQTLTSEIRSILYKLARLNQLSKKISSVPKETKPLSKKAINDLNDNSTISNRKQIKE